MSPDISIVIPTFRRPSSLQEAIRSVLQQRDVAMEVLVIDDCPDGSAAAALRELTDPRLRYMRNPEPSRGRPSRVRNLGWPLVSGPIVHFMDDDDLLPEGIYADAVATFKQRPGLGLVFGGVECFGEPSKELAEDSALFARAARRANRLQKLGLNWLFAPDLLFNEVLFVGGCSIMRRSAIAAVGGYNPQIPIMEDIDILARITRRFGARYLNRLSLYYRVGPSLMHREHRVQELIVESYQRIHANYRRDFGALEFLGMKIAARTLLKLWH
jgi:glycosyltransferase involved in cell wall biosynthesis